MNQDPPLLAGPTDKERKYDRQLRLWAASGQTALETANILLVNSGCGTVGIETLKNLVLPGIGQFTIFDDAFVKPEDLGINFFLHTKHLGQPRAQCCAELLQELNEDVRCDWFPKQNVTELAQLLSNSTSFSLILYALPALEKRVTAISSYAQQHRIPTIAVRSLGFYSYFQLKLPDIFPVVDTHPDENSTADLRLLDPWPELSAFAKEMTDDIDSLDHHQHGHLPMVVILLHYLDKWKFEHDNSYPTTYTDKVQFRKVVSAAMRKDTLDGGEENFEEAVSAVMKHVVRPNLPSAVGEVFAHERIERPDSSTFWAVAKAVKEFYEANGRLPVPGGLPDMKAQSDIYISLQKLYKQKARKDADDVLRRAQSSIQQGSISLNEVELFCTNARFIKLINSAEKRSVDMEQIAEREIANDKMAELAGPEMPPSLLPIYLALLTTSKLENPSTEEIVSSVTADCLAYAHENQYTRIEQAAKEVSRSAEGELHNISAVTGGMVAQEIIKIITRQYVPVDNTCIFDGIESRCQIIRL